MSTNFSDAIQAVEQRDYRGLREILDESPEILSYSGADGCDLFCEFSGLLRNSTENDIDAQIDLFAFEVLQEYGGVPAPSEITLRRLLAASEGFFGAANEYPVSNGECTLQRDAFIPWVNTLVELGAPLSRSLQIPNASEEFSLGFHYVISLCNPAFLCGAQYESPNEYVTGIVYSSLTENESELLLLMRDHSLVADTCVHQFLRHQEPPQ